MRILLAGCLATIVAASMQILGPSANASVDASRDIDRRFLCSPGFVGGSYSIFAHASTGIGRTREGWKRPTFVAVGSSLAGAAFASIPNYLVWITGGPPARTASVTPADATLSFPFSVWGTVSVQRGVCRATTSRVAVGTRGLRRREVTPFFNLHDCVTPRRVLVRVRARLERPSTLKSFRGYLRTPEPATTAEVMVRTPSGRPVLYAQVLESGKARLFTAPGCIED